MLEIAVDEHEQDISSEGHSKIDWETWNVDTEIQDVRRFHFEDLDQTDQMLCPAYCTAIAICEALLGSVVTVAMKSKLADVVRHLRSFAEQAQQLYGKEACATKTATMMKQGLA